MMTYSKMTTYSSNRSTGDSIESDQKSRSVAARGRYLAGPHAILRVQASTASLATPPAVVSSAGVFISNHRIHLFKAGRKRYVSTQVARIDTSYRFANTPCQLRRIGQFAYNDGMNPSHLANLLGISSNSIRRWSEQFSHFLSASARPAPGEPRIYTKLDAQIMHFIATKRAAHRPNEEIAERLSELRAGEWRDLPPLPENWPDMETALVPSWNIGAGTLAQISTLQTELQFTQKQRDQALARVDTLEAEIDALRASQSATEAELSAKQTELLEARAVVARVEGQMSQYTLGRDKPLNVGVIIIAALAAGAALMLIAFVVLRLAG